MNRRVKKKKQVIRNESRQILGRARAFHLLVHQLHNPAAGPDTSQLFCTTVLIGYRYPIQDSLPLFHTSLF